MVDRVVLASVGVLAALPEKADHLDRLLEHRDPFVWRGPAGAGDVLVQVLARAEPEREAARQHRADGGRGLRDDRRMRANQRARDPRRDFDPLGCLRDPAQHAPDERALSLRVDPGMEVVGDHREREAELLRSGCVADEVERCMLLGRQPVAELGHAALATARGIAETRLAYEIAAWVNCRTRGGADCSYLAQREGYALERVPTSRARVLGAEPLRGFDPWGQQSCQQLRPPIQRTPDEAVAPALDRVQRQQLVGNLLVDNEVVLAFLHDDFNSPASDVPALQRSSCTAERVRARTPPSTSTRRGFSHPFPPAPTLTLEVELMIGIGPATSTLGWAPAICSFRPRINAWFRA